MPTAVEHQISINVDPFSARQETPDIFNHLSGLQIPGTVDVQHTTTSDALSLNFTLTGGELSLDIHLLVPAVKPTDFLIG